MPATVTAKGQITIPKPIRDLLGIEPGSKVEFRINEAGQVVVEKEGARRPSRFAHLVGHAGPGPTTDELMQMLRGED